MLGFLVNMDPGPSFPVEPGKGSREDPQQVWGI